MIDRYGVVWESSGRGGPRRKGHVGGGRPLGFHFDHAGNLVVCNTASVSFQLCICLLLLDPILIELVLRNER